MRLNTDARFTRGRQTPAITAVTIAVTGFAVLALLAPFGDAEQPLTRVGALLAPAADSKSCTAFAGPTWPRCVAP